MQFSDLKPESSSAGKEEYLREALKSRDTVLLTEVTQFELDKQIRIGSLGSTIFTESELPPDSAAVNANTLYKHKLADDRFTCRITASGRNQPVDYSLVDSTSTSSASESDKFFQLSYMQAYCKSRDEELILSDYDIIGGFLRIKRNGAHSSFSSIFI
jgi:hypothetical protein